MASEITVKTEHALRPILLTLAIAIPLAVIGIVSGIIIEGAPFSEAEGGVFYAFLNAIFICLLILVKTGRNFLHSSKIKKTKPSKIWTSFL